MEEKYCVYVHILKKYPFYSYVGMTKNAKVRFNNGHGYSSQIKFARAIDIYGWKNFKHIILKDNLSKEEAYEEEKRYIKLYNSINNGFNEEKGGKATTSFLRGSNPSYNVTYYRIMEYFEAEKGGSQIDVSP